VRAHGVGKTAVPEVKRFGYGWPLGVPALDEAWAEPEAFGGCSSAGQARPEQPQPIQIHRRASAPARAA